MPSRYIGSKARIADSISQHVGSRKAGDGVFIDAFCGTGVVAERVAALGWPIRLNDHLVSAVTVAAARITSPEDVPFKSLGGYGTAIDVLNELPGIRGFVWREYSPASSEVSPAPRKYFTEANASRIDAVRSQIARWSTQQIINRAEERLLIADLLVATSRVANIAGTYGCFLSHWTPGSLEPLVLRERKLFPRHVDFQVSNMDVSVLTVSENDVVYLDPPYTKRQYAAYYHLPETISLGDEPSVTGRTGLRPWRDKASDFCYRRRALAAIETLAARIPARHIFLSYSSEGHVALAPLQAALSKLGSLDVHEMAEVGRYRPNQAASKAGSGVKEYLFELYKAYASETRTG